MTTLPLVSRFKVSFTAVLVAVCLLPLSQVVAARTASAMTGASPGQALYHCVAAARVQTPPLLTRASGVEDLKAVCAAGQVPQPVGSVAAKGMPLGRVQAQPQSVFYFYDYAYQYYNAIGASGNFSQEKPYLATADYHSLAEIAGESSDGQQIIEIGWNVDRGVNNGDTHPHLFIFHWINGQPTCYNGCGFVQVSKTRFPGMRVQVTKTPQQYAIEYMQGNWWLWYQSEWIGYFPGSLWSNFTQLGLTQWFGEVAASSQTPCTDMGDGTFGTQPGAAKINKMLFLSGPPASATSGQTNPSYYDIGHFTGSSYHYGGPGAC